MSDKKIHNIYDDILHSIISQYILKTTCRTLLKYYLSYRQVGDLTQSVERFISIEKAGRSTRSFSIFYCKLSTNLQ